MNEKIATPDAPQAIGPYSQAIRSGNFLFVSGQIAIDPQAADMIEGDIEAQTQQALKNVAAIIDAAGMSLQDVVKCTCFLKDMSDFVKFNGVYENYSKHCVSGFASIDREASVLEFCRSYFWEDRLQNRRTWVSCSRQYFPGKIRSDPSRWLLCRDSEKPPP